MPASNRTSPILLFNGGVGSALGNILSGKKVPLPPLPKADLDGPGYPATVRQWAKANGCNDTFTDEHPSKTVIRRTFACPAASPVVFDIVQGGGHTWPGTQFSKNLASIMGATDDFAANPEIWSFLRRFALPPT